jgi:hypothetical protein
MFLASLALAPVQAAIGWHDLRDRGSAGELLAVVALSLFTLAALALLVSVGRNRSAKWVLTILCAIGLPLMLESYERGAIVGSLPLALVQGALQVGSLALLFAPSARKWLAGDR